LEAQHPQGKGYDRRRYQGYPRMCPLPAHHEEGLKTKDIGHRSKEQFCLPTKQKPQIDFLRFFVLW
jgi:hypothetical protein